MNQLILDSMINIDNDSTDDSSNNIKNSSVDSTIINVFKDQLESKDKQIDKLQNLLDQQQQLSLTLVLNDSMSTRRHCSLSQLIFTTTPGHAWGRHFFLSFLIFIYLAALGLICYMRIQ